MISGEPPPAQRRLPPRRFVVGFIGGICGYTGMMLAGEWGWPTAEFFLIGVLLGTIFAGRVVKNAHVPMDRGIRRASLWVAILLLSTGLAHYSVRVNPRAAFGRALGLDVPSGVSGLHAWRQYLDGQTYLLSFNANEQAIKSILATAGFSYEQEDEMSQSLRDARPQDLEAVLSAELVVPDFDVEHLQVTKLSQARVWRFNWKEQDSDEQIMLIWDPTTHRAFVSRYWG
jgi:hypothetical protein